MVQEKENQLENPMPPEAQEPDLGTLLTMEIPLILDQLPPDGHPTVDFSQRGPDWLFKFTFVSINARFAAVGVGSSPFQAFSIGRQVLDRQIREWHQARLAGRPYFAIFDNRLGFPRSLDTSTAASPHVEAPRRPLTALIIDDDVDTALAVESIFKQLGCQTEVITQPDDLPRKISSTRADYIILDWRLGDQLLASQVVERATRFIDVFSDLRQMFVHARPKVITYSALPYSEISFPKTEYFDHLDHWQKPISFSELALRFSELLETGWA